MWVARLDSKKSKLQCMQLKIWDGDRCAMPTTSIKKLVGFMNPKQNGNQKKSMATYKGEHF